MEWIVKFPEELVFAEPESAYCEDGGNLVMEHMLADPPRRVAKVEIFSNEHPPPHFRVLTSEKAFCFDIDNCSPLPGQSIDGKTYREILKWHGINKERLVDLWNKTRPTNCPVGPIE